MTYEAAFAAFILGTIFTTAAVSIRAYARRGHDVSDVSGSVVLGPLIRSWHFENLRPLEDWCVRRGIQPATLTYAQLVGSLLVGGGYAAGFLFTSGWLLLASGSLDIVDGRLARRTGTGSARGAFLDSVIDRYADSFVYIGLSIYFRDSWVLWITLLGLLGGAMVSYTRARAESLGVDCRVGLLQRPERTVILGLGTIFSVLVDRLTGPWLGQDNAMLVLTLLVIAALANVSAVHRALYVRRELGDKVDA